LPGRNNLLLNIPTLRRIEATPTRKESAMPLGKPRKLKLRSEKLPKVASMTVIKGPGNLSTFEPPVETSAEKPQHPHAR
jgi:hypothetical protein